MSTFKCKMCGGTLEIQSGQTVAECEYCGTQQTLPKLENDRRANLYDRANHFRRNNEFDKAMGIYEQILNEDSTDAEAYWSLVLCRYGIEYVEDPATHKRVPTVNRAQFTSVFDDDNYKSALQYADSYQHSIYEDEAKTINEIQKGILAISQKEEPFDVFICYKESDNNGRRTPDSVLANDLYHQLTQEGFKVFFARITLEDKLGSAYEPYIFAALNSAKVMVVLGTKPEYFSAVWVKNEWSRYLALIKQEQKKMLIPAYKDMDPYDLPEEFSHLQAQDMSKLGFMQDLIRGIKKITQVDAPQTTVVRETVISDNTSNTAPLLKRAYIFLEDGDWASADEYCEKVLDIDPENGEAYLGKTLAQEKCRTVDEFVRKRKSVSEESRSENLHLEPNCAHVEEIAGKYAIAHYLEKDGIRKIFDYDLTYSSSVADRKQQYQAEESYWANHKLLSRAEKFTVGAVAENLTREKKALFDFLSDRVKQAENAEKSEKEELLKRYVDFLKQTDAEVEELYRNVLNIRESNYENWLKKAKEEINPEILKKLEQCFTNLGDFRDSKSLAEYCRKRAVEEQARIDTERVQAKENARKKAERIAKRNKKIAIINLSIIFAIIFLIIVLNMVDKYKDSTSKIEESNINNYGEEVWNNIKSVNVGDMYVFGSYEQDNNKSNGQEDIEWLVLAKDGTKILVISKYALDCQQYNTSNTDVTWETCTLRKWLNNDFINSAFTADEKAMIHTVTVSANKNPIYGTNPGNATFLLSITEANKYFSSDSARQCKSTKYAEANGAYVNSSNQNCWWWLRSPGDNQDDAAYVHTDGDVIEYGYRVSSGGRAVRSALWIDLNS